MSYDAGSITATAELDRTPFQQGLRLLRQEARDLEREKVTPTADLDTTRADQKVVDFRSRLDRIAATRATAQVAVENGQAIRSLIDTSDRLDKLRATVATARADVDDQRAKDKLDALDLQLRRVGLITARPRVTLDGVQRANLQLDTLAAKLAVLQRGSAGGGGRGRLGGGEGSGFFGSLASHAPSFMSLGVGAALPIAGPLAGAALGAGASFLTPTLAGLGGVIPFAAAARSSIAALEKDQQKLTVLQGRYNAAVTNKQRAAALRQEHLLWQSLDPAQRKALTNIEALDARWKTFQRRLQPKTFGALSGASKIADTGLGFLLPVARDTGTAIVDLEKQAEHAFTRPFWHTFFSFLQTEAPLAVRTLGTVLGNVGTGMAHLAIGLSPLGHDLEGVLVNLSKRFEQWSAGSGPAKFSAWVEKEAPVVEKALGGLAHGLEGVGRGLFPIGQVELKALTPVLNFIGDLGDQHPAVITAVGTALLGVGAGLKVIAGVRGIAGAVGSIGRLGRGGGGIGGAISKAAPIPVYVTNWEGGGHLPGGGKEPVPVGGKTSWATRLRNVLPAPAVIAAAYLATQGGDQAPGQTPLGGSTLRNGPAITNLISGVGPRIPLNQGQDFFTGSLDQPGGRPVNPTALVRNTLAFGTAQQIKQLQELGKTYPAISTALKDYNKQQDALNKLLVVNPGLAKNAAAANRIVDGSLQSLAKGARAAGVGIGTDLGQGLIQGLEQRIPHVTVAGKLLVQSTAKAMRLAAETGSPSKVTMRIGRDMADGLGVGFTDRMSAISAMLAGAAGGALRVLAGALADGQSILQNRLAGARGQLSSDIAARQGAVSSVAGSLYGAADISNAYVNGRVGNISGFLGSVARPEERLVRDLHRLRKLHLSGRLLGQIAGQSPTAALAEAENILSGKSGSIRRLDRLDAQIYGYAQQAGQTVGGALYDSRISGDRAKVDEMVTALHQLNRNIEAVKEILKKNPHDFADALDAAFRGEHHKHHARSSH